MKYDASGQKPASANGFHPGVEVEWIKNGRRGVVHSTNCGPGINEVRVRWKGPLENAFEPYDRKLFQTALSIT